MYILEIILLAVALGLDAFSVAVAIGACLQKSSIKQKFRLSFYFGFFQFAMPIIGWYAGKNIEQYISSFDHWIVFIILSLLGGKMIYDGLNGNIDNSITKDITKGFALFVLAIATSLDALAIGFSLGLVKQDIFFISVVIGIIAAAMTLIGVKIGEKASQKFNGKAFVFGGVILILIAAKILFEHIF